MRPPRNRFPTAVCFARNRRAARRQSGAVMIWAVLALTGLIAFAALTIDGGLIWTARTQLQTAADGASMAAMDAYSQGGRMSDAITEAKTIGNQHRAMDASVDIQGTDVVLGTWDYGSRQFSPGPGFGAPAIQVTAKRSGGVTGGALPLAFAGLLGKPTVDVAAASVTAIARRDLVLVQDRTLSFEDEFPAATRADKLLVEAMDAQGVPGDRMALVTFARDVRTHADLTRLTGGGVTVLQDEIDDFQVCRDDNPPDCHGTDIGIGIDRAREIFEEQSVPGEAERVMVIVSDGVPCLGEFWPNLARMIGEGEDIAEEAADRAAEHGINIFVITLRSRFGFGCFTSNVEFNESLARGYGKGFTTPDPEDLDDLLSSILAEMPVRLVR